MAKARISYPAEIGAIERQRTLKEIRRSVGKGTVVEFAHGVAIVKGSLDSLLIYKLSLPSGYTMSDPR